MDKDAHRYSHAAFLASKKHPTDKIQHLLPHYLTQSYVYIAMHCFFFKKFYIDSDADSKTYLIRYTA